MRCCLVALAALAGLAGVADAIYLPGAVAEQFQQGAEVSGWRRFAAPCCRPGAAAGGPTMWPAASLRGWGAARLRQLLSAPAEACAESLPAAPADVRRATLPRPVMRRCPSW